MTINPAAGYCMAHGDDYMDTAGDDGSMTSSCVLPGGQGVDAWQFLQDKAAPGKISCTAQGLEARTVRGQAVGGIACSTCAVRGNADGSPQEVRSMMQRDFRGKICSGDVCCDPVLNATCVIGTESLGRVLLMSLPQLSSSSLLPSIS